MVIEPENKTCSTTQAVAQPVNIPATAAAENFQNMKGFEMLKYNFHCHFYCPRYQQAQLRDPNANIANDFFHLTVGSSTADVGRLLPALDAVVVIVFENITLA